MPRRARIDAPGALHHIICRGIERRKIFRNNTDKDDFVNRLSQVLSETNTPCYAWALLSNHLHLLLRTGNAPIATIMRKVLTGYEVNFNQEGIGLNQSSVRRAVGRGENHVNDRKLRLIEA